MTKSIHAIAILMSILSFSFHEVRASKIDEVEQYDLRFYSPINYGLKDLVFEVRISNLTELLRDEMALTTVVDAYYKVYWIFPGQFRIEVEGLPRGFDELKSELRQMIREHLEIVIPQPLGNRLRSFELSYLSRGQTVQVQGVDQTQTRSVNRIEVVFEPNGKLKSIEAFSPGVRVLSEMESSVKPWSHNKWVLDKLTTTTRGQTYNKTVNEISYTSVAGIGFPERIRVRSVHRPIVPEGYDGEVPEVEAGSEIQFSKYEVNTGKAQRFMVQGLSR